MCRGDVAADGPTLRRVARIRGRQGYDEHGAADLGNHQPVGRGFGRIEQRVAAPHVVDVVDAERVMLEQVWSLPGDLERVVLIEQVCVEQVILPRDCNTNEYESLGSAGSDPARLGRTIGEWAGAVRAP